MQGKQNVKKHGGQNDRHNMISCSVPIFVESRYRVSRKRIKQTIVKVLTDEGMTSAIEVSVAIVGNRKMRQLNKKYRNIDKPTNVLSFPQAEGENIPVSSDTLQLGDIILCYPIIVQESARDDVLVDDKINELVAHSVNHLLGIHH